ncbi:hypothetical protein [Paracoccus onubensis]|uniref:Uncharacterized protein n=1 Tax=Paracoccus onubensis TaxID=1675788 RepID=A0A418SU89_9RHOB|nr:hypothetical protein [Paracoccus onubensis]RJE84505.1 hypothetical protein D3P04_12710 [Paracoccus onubensis]
MTNSVKRMTELLLPGSMLGVIASFAVGGVALYGGLPIGYVVVSVLALGIPLALFGAGYSLLLAQARIRIGGITPAVGYWLIGYTVSRTIYEVVINLYLGSPSLLSDGVLAFFGFQLLVSTGFAVGFMWLHENIAPMWWVHIRDRNPIAAAYVAAYTQQAAYTKQSKEQATRS